jgi:nucleoside-diphosphate-sugar epimerase
MTTERKKVIISGADGFIGSHLTSHLIRLGYQIRGLTQDRTKVSDTTNLSWHYCDLPEEIDESVFSGDAIYAFVHCAYDTRFKSWEQSYATNILGTKKLLNLSRKNNIERFIFLSSFSAHEGVKSFYGRSKYEIEKMLDIERDTILRPGFVIGHGGLFCRIVESIRNFPVVPVFYGGRQMIQTIAVDDLIQCIANVLNNNIHGRFFVAENKGAPIKEFYASIANALGYTRIFLPLPGDIALFLVRLSERIGIGLPVSSENILGLKGMKSFVVDEDMKRLGVEPQPMKESILYYLSNTQREK